MLEKVQTHGAHICEAEAVCAAAESTFAYEESNV